MFRPLPGKYPHAAQLGAASERIRQLEEQLKLLEAPRKPARLPWWKNFLALNNWDSISEADN